MNTITRERFLGKIITTVMPEVAGVDIYCTSLNDFKKPGRNPGIYAKVYNASLNCVIGQKVFEIYAHAVDEM